MGRGTSTTGVEQATVVYTAAVTSATTFALGVLCGYFNVFISGTFSATAQLEKSYNGGSTWVVCSTDASGTAASYSSSVSVIGFEPELGVEYRVNCTAFTSGTMNWRVSQNINSRSSVLGVTG